MKKILKRAIGLLFFAGWPFAVLIVLIVFGDLSPRMLTITSFLAVAVSCIFAVTYIEML